MIIIDVGAGAGDRCSKWLQRHPDALVYALEPDPRQFAKLETMRKSLSKQQQSRIKTFNAAVWNSNGNIPFYVCNDISSSSALPFVQCNIDKWKYPPARQHFKTIETISVPSITLEQLIKNEKIDIIDYLRIDAQGCAGKILEGLSGNRFRYIKEIYVKVNTDVIEIYKDQAYSKQIQERLKRHFFNIKSIEPYSLGQECWLRCVSEVWEKSRGSKIYGLD